MKIIAHLLFAAMFLHLSIGKAQNTATSDEGETAKVALSDDPGNTTFLLSGAAWFGFNYNNDAEVKFNFNSYGFTPVMLWKLSDRMFLESEIEISNGEIELEYAKLSYSVNDYMTIGAGRMLTPFGAYGEHWEPAFVERFPNDPLRPDDDFLPDNTHLYWGAIMGMDVRGGFPVGSAKMNYALFVSNGPLLSTDENGAPTGIIQYENLLDENNDNKEIGGRLGVLPFSNSSLEIGVSAKHGVAGNVDDPEYEDIGATAFAADLNFVRAVRSIKSIVGIRGQFTQLSVDDANYLLNDSVMYTFDNTTQNYFVQFSFRPSMVENNFLKNLEFLLRYNSLKPPEDAVWGGDAITRLDIGIDYWLSWRTGLRFAYETTSYPGDLTTNEFIARFVMGL